MRLGFVLVAMVIAACDGSGDEVVDSSDPPNDTDLDSDDTDTMDSGEEPAAWPATLSQTGLYSDFSSREIASDVLAYEVA